MRSINLIFGCHSHQPVGNFDFVFDEAYRKAYLPFVEVLERFPSVHVTLHYTGPLLDWFAKERPEYLARLRALVVAGQIEIMGGGFYEPLLCAIPERDAIAQIARMQRFCEEHFGVRPRGMWLTERVWEPQMARTLARAGVEYTALDDTHFLCSGVPRESLFGYHMTEDEGLTVKVFPILEKLRYIIPFAQVSETIEFLREHATEDGTRCAVFHDDGEKFGVWPYTYQSVYEKGWLVDFFTALEENADWLRTRTYSEYIAMAKPAGRSYITCASYFEMMEWALPTDLQRKLHAAQHEAKADPEKYERYGQFLRGGFWRGFLAKYPESNNIQKRMLRVSRRVERLRAERRHCEEPSDEAISPMSQRQELIAEHPAEVPSGLPLRKRGTKGDLIPCPTLDEAERLLHEGQCNCAYWHGAFGGVYLNHLRTALYERVIAADALLDTVEHRGADWETAEQTDFDGDGNDEAVLENSNLTAILSAADGGTLFELDYKPRPFNFLNTLARREEPYHDALRQGLAVKAGEAHGGSIHDLVQVKEEGLENFLVYDPYRRASLRDHLYGEAPTVDGLVAGEGEGGEELWSAASPYALELAGTSAILRRSGGPGEAEVFIEKRVSMLSGITGLQVEYAILNAGVCSLTAHFGVEFGVNLLTGTAHDRYLYAEDGAYGPLPLGSIGERAGLTRLALRDDWMGLEFGVQFGQAAHLYHFPIDTVSQSEAGQERVHQGCVLLPTWPLTLAPGASWRQTITIVLRRTRA
jgi:hypothetical protein